MENSLRLMILFYFSILARNVCISVFSLSIEVKCSFVKGTSQPLLTRVYLIWICAPRIIELPTSGIFSFLFSVCALIPVDLLGGGRGGPEVWSVIKRSSGGINFTQANIGFILGHRHDFFFFCFNNTKALQKNKPIKNKMTNKR